MARSAHLDHLASVPLFSACTRKELQHVAQTTDELDVAAGTVLCEQGAIGREAFVVVEGTATVRRSGRKVATLGPGTCIGELALLDHGPRTATVVADTPMTVLVIGPREFAGLLESVPSIARKLLQSLAARIRDLDSKTYG
ncbi:MAG: cyclic nucleotide-binding domain-containing protein [Acidimicrobiia bacterium]